jgi:plastocyanin
MSEKFMGMIGDRPEVCTLLLRGMLKLTAIAFVVLLATSTGTASQPAVVIKMLDMPPSFQPSSVTIKVGDTVEWENVGNSVHHATNDHDVAIKKDDVSSPNDKLVFDSGFLQPGGTFTHTFTAAGTYKYVCVVHEPSGMTGQIVVK